MGKKRLTVEEILERCKAKEEEIEMAGGTLLVRGLTKDRQMQVRRESTRNETVETDLFELALFRAGVVEPEMTEDQVVQLKDSISAGSFDQVVNRIMVLSGIRSQEEAAKLAQLFRP